MQLAPAGIIMFAVGIIPFTIGGMISLATRYDVHNRHIRGGFDPKRPKTASPNLRELWDAYFNNPASRWWCRAGLLICSVGMGLQFLDEFFRP